MAGPALDLVGNPRADTVTGPAADGDIGEDVVATLHAVRASDSLGESLRPFSRAPGHLWWSWGVVSEDELRDVVGFAPLRLPGPATRGLSEVFAVAGHGGEARYELDGSGRPVTESFAVFYLPRSWDWRNARRSSVLRSDTVAIHVRAADDRDWPATMPHRRHEFDEDGTVRLPGVRTDCAVVRVHETDVAVQVDVSGAVALGWRLHRDVRGTAQRWDVELLARRDRVEALRTVHAAGLLV